MPQLDAALRAMLRRRAARVTPPEDLTDAVRLRARAIKRRRLLVLLAVGVLSVLGVSLAVQITARSRAGGG